MATWVNLLDAIYPAGSVYLSRNATSPASLIGGTWTQIKGAVLAAAGSNGFATNAYGGRLAISINQIPAHTHTLTFTFGTGDSGYIPLGNVGGDKPTSTTPIESTGGGQNFLPYHYGVYVWYRTA